MADGATTESDVSGIISVFDRLADSLVAGLLARVTQLRNVGQEFDALNASFAAAGTSASAMFFKAVLVVALVGATYFYVSRAAAKRTVDQPLWRRTLAGLAAAALAIVVGFVAARIMSEGGVPMRVLRIWTVVTVAGLVVIGTLRHMFLSSREVTRLRHSRRIAVFHRDLSIAIGIALVGLAWVAGLRLWGAGPGITDIVGTSAAVLTYGLYALAVWRHRRTMAVAVSGQRPRSRWRLRFSKVWPTIVLIFLAITFVSTQTALTFRAALPGAVVLMTALIFLATPHLDTMIGNWARRGLLSPRISVASAAMRQTARFTVLALLIAMLGTLWAAPLATVLGFNLRTLAMKSVEIALITLVAAYMWNIVGTLCTRALRVEMPALDHGDEELATPRSRLGTLVPLLSAVGKSMVVVLAGLSILVSIGVTVWPLITGLGVFGLALGFGSQTLVKDIVSGLFFLIDDAFRFGEYIETSGAKGTVERISVRSVSLRHQRGSVATIPYGQIGKIQNYSRDWMIEKLTFRVAFDTDVEKVRKLFKKIGQEIADDPEISGDLLEPFKSQGIADVEDGTLVIRAKFKAKAGKQSMIRRAVMKKVHDAFLENGIKAVPKPITSTPDASGPA